QVPSVNHETVLERRKLPDMGVEYPYLTVSDFLEPYLIRLVYPINKDKYFDGNFEAEVGDDSKGYILPLKKMFFDYFNTDDLMSLSIDKPKISLTQGAAGSVKVVLQIPIAKYGEHVTLERIYHVSQPEKQLIKPDEEKNRGVIIEHQVGVSIYPWVKTNDPELGAYYRIQVVDRNIAGIFKGTDYNLQFYSDLKNNPISVKNEESQNTGKPRKRSSKDYSDATTQYYVLEDEFNYIQIKDGSNPEIKGMIIPKWPGYNGGKAEFSFAIDFGTTNTHIEYKTTSSGPKAFDISNDDIQIATLFDSNRTSEDFGGTGAIAIREMIDYEFVPQTIGSNSIYKFPTRTVSGESKAANNTNQSSFALADYNIPFNYEKSHDPVNEIKSNLKWAKSDLANTKRVAAYFEKLFLLMRNKVLRGGGNIKQTKLVWFYPSSMTKERREKLEDLVNKLTDKYFKSKSKPVGLSESLAPYYYYKATGQIPGGGHTPVISIDIGGGTTDVVVFKSNKPILLTSFKFAANSVFGDGFYEYGATSNGLINKYLPYFNKLLIDNKQHNLIQVLESIKGRNKSDDIVAFLFSLENNHRIQDKTLFSFNNVLTDDPDFKIVFLYFYTAIIYYTAQLIRKELGASTLPSNVVFSGTGSKILQIVSPSQKTISQLTQRIFEEVSGLKYGAEGLVVKIEREFPKELTCKGGLMLETSDLEQDIKQIKKTLTCLEDKGIAELRFNMLNDEMYRPLNSWTKRFYN
nr:cell division protein FtsA [Saprospiraceae bacterium]